MCIMRVYKCYPRFYMYNFVYLPNSQSINQSMASEGVRKDTGGRSEKIQHI